MRLEASTRASPPPLHSLVVAAQPDLLLLLTTLPLHLLHTPVEMMIPVTAVDMRMIWVVTLAGVVIPMTTACVAVVVEGGVMRVLLPEVIKSQWHAPAMLPGST